MAEAFWTLVNQSITTGWVILAILLFRLLFRRAPKRILCLLWGVAALRLVLPFSLESVISLIPSSQTVESTIHLSPVPTVDSGVGVIDRVVNPILTDTFAPEPGASVNPLQVVTAVAANLWLLGMVALVLYAIVSYCLLRRRVATAVPYETDLCPCPVKQCETVASPFILGFVRPKVYLPFVMEAEAIPYVLRHEAAHIRRGDPLWKLIGYLLLTVFWFNPLVWVAYLLFCRDVELACDEAVLREEDEAGRCRYAEALLSCQMKKPHLSAGLLAFGEVSIGTRIKQSLHYKKPALWLVILSLILAAALTGCLLTDPVELFQQPATPGTPALVSLDNIVSGGTTDKIEMIYRGLTVSDDGRLHLNVTLKNHTAGDVIFGVRYMVERLVDGQWVSCVKEGVSDLVFIEIAYVLAPFGERNESLTIHSGDVYGYDGYFELTESGGRYRVSIPMSVEESDDETVWLEFTAHWNESAAFAGGQILSVGSTSEDFDISFRHVNWSDKKHLRIIFISYNQTGGLYSYGLDYQVQYRENGEWVDCAPHPDLHHGFPEILYQTDSPAEEWDCDASLFDLSRAGRYRLVKPLGDDGAFVWVEFQLFDGEKAPAPEPDYVPDFDETVWAETTKTP